MNTEKIMNIVLDYGLKVAMALVALFLGLMLIKIVANSFEKAMRSKNVDPTLRPFLKGIVSFGLKIALVISILGMVGIKTTSFVAVLGAAGLAVGLSLQGSLSNFAGGVLLLILRPFKVGDFIEAQGHSGTVAEVGIIFTKMKTGDNKVIIIPNGPLASSSIVNYSTEATRRVDWTVGIAYDDDLKKAQTVLNNLLSEEERILKDKDTLVKVSELADNSVNFVVRAWVNSGDYWGVKFDMTEKIKLAFDKEGLNFPFPQRELHIVGNNPIN